MKLLHILFAMLVISALTVDGMCCLTACFTSSIHLSNHAPHVHISSRHKLDRCSMMCYVVQFQNMGIA